jgi:hypothetical protein
MGDKSWIFTKLIDREMNKVSAVVLLETREIQFWRLTSGLVSEAVSIS